jgi:hypothetical protein
MTGKQTLDWCVQDVQWLYITGAGFYFWGNFQSWVLYKHGCDCRGLQDAHFWCMCVTWHGRIPWSCMELCGKQDFWMQSKETRWISAYFLWYKTHEWPWNSVLDYIICGSKLGTWIHTEGNHSELLLNRILGSSAFLIGIHYVHISLKCKYTLLHNMEVHSSWKSLTSGLDPEVLTCSHHIPTCVWMVMWGLGCIKNSKWTEEGLSTIRWCRTLPLLLGNVQLKWEWR